MRRGGDFYPVDTAKEETNINGLMEIFGSPAQADPAEISVDKSVAPVLLRASSKVSKEDFTIYSTAEGRR